MFLYFNWTNIVILKLRDEGACTLAYITFHRFEIVKFKIVTSFDARLWSACGINEASKYEGITMTIETRDEPSSPVYTHVRSL
jgi:hypothetical protein